MLSLKECANECIPRSRNSTKMFIPVPGGTFVLKSNTKLQEMHLNGKI